MNNYITLDGKKYKCPWRAWSPEGNVPSAARLLLDGTSDIVFGSASILTWSGEIEAPVTPEDALWGKPEDLKCSLTKRTTLTFIDHYGVTYTVLAKGPFKERSLSPKWDSESNVMFISAMFVTVNTSVTPTGIRFGTPTVTRL